MQSVGIATQNVSGEVNQQILITFTPTIVPKKNSLRMENNDELHNNRVVRYITDSRPLRYPCPNECGKERGLTKQPDIASTITLDMQLLVNAKMQRHFQVLVQQKLRGFEGKMCNTFIRKR